MLETEKDKEMILIINDLLACLDNYFINQLSTFEHQIDINYPIV
jgi:hypothetical protein